MIKCQDCGERKYKIKFCESVVDFTHGNIIYICRQCYIKILEKTLKNCTNNIKKQKELLEKENGRLKN